MKMHACAAGMLLQTLDFHADARHPKAGADNPAGRRVERFHVAGNSGQRNEDHCRGNA